MKILYITRDVNTNSGWGRISSIISHGVRGEGECF